MSQGKIVGIDLGTTHSLVAVLEGAAPVLIPGAMNEALTPSVVAVTPLDEVVVGRAAREMAASDPAAACAVFKRDMGTEVEHSLGGRKMSPQVLSGIVLRRLRQDAEEYLGEPVQRAVVTVPAYFNDAQRQATLDAGELAGLEVVRVLNEPTAAALAYGIHADPAPRKLLVFDLGGGTFDISIVDCEDGVIEVCASAGEAFLGGEDFTRQLVGLLLARHDIALDEFERSSPLLFAKLRYRVEKAKCALSEVDEINVTLPDPAVRDGSYAAKWVETIRREDLAKAGASLIERFRPVTWRALRDAGLRPDEISDVLLVGGASRMTLVREFLVGMFGREPRCDIDPDSVVAMGAAVQAALVEGHSAVEDIVATDVMPHTLGTEVSKEIGSRIRSGIFLPIIERNTTIPVSRTTTLSTMQDGQTEMVVDVYQGESRAVSENLLLGKLRVTGMPARPKGRESIEVRFTYDLNGVLEVEVKTLSTGTVQQMVLEQRPGKLSRKELKHALRAMKDLKVELRDRDEYRFVLAKAQRMFAEFIGPYRQRLGELIDEFENALADGDADAIQSFRSELEIVMSLLEGDGESGDGRG